jgi:uncharacterized protein RhaS with RHS repeats
MKTCFRFVFATIALLSAVSAHARFLQTDPIGTKDDLNLYAYVANDPLNRTDPLGTYACGDSVKAANKCDDFNAAQDAAKATIKGAIGILKSIQGKIGTGQNLTAAESKFAAGVDKYLGKGASSNAGAVGALIGKASAALGALNSTMPADLGNPPGGRSAQAPPGRLVLSERKFFGSSEANQANTLGHETGHHTGGNNDDGLNTAEGKYIGGYGAENAALRASTLNNPLKAMQWPDAVALSLGFGESSSE